MPERPNLRTGILWFAASGLSLAVAVLTYSGRVQAKWFVAAATGLLAVVGFSTLGRSGSAGAVRQAPALFSCLSLGALTVALYIPLPLAGILPAVNAALAIAGRTRSTATAAAIFLAISVALSVAAGLLFIGSWHMHSYEPELAQEGPYIVAAIALVSLAQVLSLKAALDNVRSFGSR